ncbi:hypothetical protein [uncultured Draconibacterium sp.]|uniref:hypothetical protein n=1 Tax=uncultured Draconibacterium sp. TaxID=1573823 RepID=UPI002AA65B3C|nr:hypothetical protein [uncultured Draconibacterium sp.]
MEFKEKLEEQKRQNEMQKIIRGWLCLNHYWKDSTGRKYRFSISNNWDKLSVTTQNKGIGDNFEYSIINQNEPFYISLSKNGYLNGNDVLNGGNIKFKVSAEEDLLILTRGAQVEEDNLVLLP